jgi:hypothetical protein
LDRTNIRLALCGELCSGVQCAAERCLVRMSELSSALQTRLLPAARVSAVCWPRLGIPPFAPISAWHSRRVGLRRMIGIDPHLFAPIPEAPTPLDTVLADCRADPRRGADLARSSARCDWRPRSSHSSAPAACWVTVSVGAGGGEGVSQYSLQKLRRHRSAHELIRQTFTPESCRSRPFPALPMRRRSKCGGICRIETNSRRREVPSFTHYAELVLAPPPARGLGKVPRAREF